ncbi:MAG: SDR family oxidoreductase [Caldilineae bacterium]|nr:MAG: SDR family oxidoreductase [Caldilineae bacterium]
MSPRVAEIEEHAADPGLVLLTGATGYVGGRLLQALEQRGYRVRAMARRPEYLQPKVAPGTEVVQGDVLDSESLRRALAGVQSAYYLVHSMGASGSFEERDRIGAENFARAAHEAGVQRIIYLGGLGDEGDELSPHLRSRQEVGAILGQTGIPVLEFRASIVIGSGSLSFEMVRALTERLPIMIAPKWVSAKAQPIAIEDLVAYLLAGLHLPTEQYGVYEIGGADQVSYADIMRIYARVRGLRIRMIPVPVITPNLSSLWLGLVTPLYARIGRKLIESIVHATVVHDDRARQVFDIQPMGVEEAVRRALANEDAAYALTRWSDAVSSTGYPDPLPHVHYGKRLYDSMMTEVPYPPEVAFAPIRQIGGQQGWYAWNRLWRLRGMLDLLMGGVGMRRGRPAGAELKPGDTVDFWRVEAYEPNRRLRLQAEMKLPGRAWLEFEVEGDDKRSTIRQTSIFDPLGFWGRLYWYAQYPLHWLVFRGMLRGIARAADQSAQGKT